MSVQERNNVHTAGSGPVTLVFAHGLGCDQSMWRLLEPIFAKRFRTVLFDHVGAGRSDLSCYDPLKYSALQGYADDLIEVIGEFGRGEVIFVGHSVGAMIGMLADLKQPGLFAAHVMIAPSPCYTNDGDYTGGFERADIESLLATMQSNYVAWASSIAPMIMGAPHKPELGAELRDSFCRTEPEIAQQFARVTFLSDYRAELQRLATPTLVLQCTDDFIAPITVGQFMSQKLPEAMLKIITNTGHCPHLTEPGACSDAMDEFIAGYRLIPEPGDSHAPAEQFAPLDIAPCGLITTNVHGVFSSANLTFCSWVGYAEHELVGKQKLQDLMTKSGRVFDQTHSLPLLHMRGSVSEVRTELVHSDGQTVPVLFNAVRHERGQEPVHDYAFFVARDRLRYEQELLRSHDELELMVKEASEHEHEAKDRALFAEQMVGIVSHDLRNPISAILMGSELLQRSGLAPNQTRYLDRMVKAARRANRLTSDLLDFTQARLGNGLAVVLKPIDLRDIVEETVEELSLVFPQRDIRHFHRGGSRCTADADRLSQLVGNLVANAVAYGDTGCPITVISAMDEESFSISVHNKGKPVAPDVLEGWFQPMVRGTSDGTVCRSVGLGLFIVSEIAKAHGGTVAVASDDEGATAFTALIPHHHTSH